MNRAPLAALALLAACSTDLDLDAKSPSAVDDSGGFGSTGSTDNGEDTDTDVEDTGPEDTGEEELDGDGDGWLPSEGDCDDTDATVFPGAEELCNDRDDDCDGVSDGDADDDGDGLRDCADACPVQVDVRAAVTPDGTWWAPFPAIQDGVDHAASTLCPVVEVSDGTYYENVDTFGYDIHIVSHDGPTATIVDGGGLAPVFSFQSGESPAAGVEGFTITGGASSAGGGIYVLESDPTITANLIELNGVIDNGGGAGVFIRDGSPVVEFNTIRENDACGGGPEEGCDGGGLVAIGGAPTIVRNDFRLNSAGDGGAMWLVRSDALVYWNLIDQNTAVDTDPVDGGQGGGIDVQIPTASTVVTNNLITNNHASTHGGGIAVFEDGGFGGGVIEHNVVAYNSVDTDNGAGILVGQYTDPLVVNNLVYDNDGPGITLNTAGEAAYNLVYANSPDWSGDQGSLTGSAGNLSTDPRVTRATNNGDGTDDDWHPTSSSPLIDAGDPAGTTDADGSRADMGAYGGTLGGW